MRTIDVAISITPRRKVLSQVLPHIQSYSRRSRPPKIANASSSSHCSGIATYKKKAPGQFKIDGEVITPEYSEVLLLEKFYRVEDILKTGSYVFNLN
jgi:hypothetical protein